MEKRSGGPLRIFVLLYRERVRLSSPQRGKKSLVQRTFFRDFIKTAHRGCGAQYSLSKNLVEFAPAGAKKVRSFSSATCAAKKIPLGLQTCAPSAQGGRRVRCSRPQTLSSKKYYFFDKDNPAGDCLRGCLSTTLQAQRSVFPNWDAGELRLGQITPTALPSSRQTAS